MPDFTMSHFAGLAKGLPHAGRNLELSIAALIDD